MISLDLAARRVVMLSMLYYGLDVSLLPDTEFDLMCKRLSDEWDELDPFRQWQLVNRDDIRASGFHTKVTPAAAYGAISWAKSLGHLQGLEVCQTQDWIESPYPGPSPTIRWLPTNAFAAIPIKKSKRRK